MRHDVGAMAELDPHGLTEVEAGGVRILLARDGEAVHAVGAVCPHKGAALKDGARVGGLVICPWHHAIFDLATGDHLQPPGKACLSRFRTNVEDGRVVVEVPEGAGVHRPEVEPRQRRRGGSDLFAIVGAGAAGLSCAEELVKLGFDGRIVLISPEAEPPYDRTELSKTYLSGKVPDEKLPMTDPTTLDALGIETRVGEVVAVDAEARELRFTDGSTLRFAKCFVAPGSGSAPLGLENADLPNVHAVRSHADAARLKAEAKDAERIVVVGAGFIGMETAAEFAGMGKEVHVLSRDELPFARQFGEAVAGQVVQRHREKGVNVHGHAEVADLLAAKGRVTAVRLRSGEVLATDLVVAAVGAAPRARVLDPEAGKGVEVDATLRFKPDVHAGGDIAAVPLPWQQGPVRIEHWRVAEQHGRHAARAMMGGAEPFDGIPFFWSAQHGRISYVGHAESFDEVHVEGDLATGSYMAFYIEGGRVLAAVGRGEADWTPALHAVMLSDRTPARERLEAAGWDPRRLLKEG